MWPVVDVNECRQSNGLCQHRCINTVGSFRCECHNGFSTQTNGRCEKRKPTANIVLSYVFLLYVSVT